MGAPDIPSSEDLARARRLLEGRLRRTPLLSLGPCATAATDVVLKLEQTQSTGAFKVRGALSAVLGAPVPAAGVVAASGGNHGAAVAWAAAQTGVKASIFVPSSSPRTKLERIQSYGADLHVVEGFYADALTAAQEFARTSGARQIHAYDDPLVVAGQATLGSELVDQLPTVTTILLAVGGGGLYAGVTLATAGRARVVPVEPVGAPTLHEALRAGRPVPVSVGGAAVDSLGAGVIGGIALAVAQAQGAIPLLVEDEVIRHAQHWLWEEARQVGEPGGVTALGALISGAYRPAEGEVVAVVISGGNTDPAALPPS